MNNNRGKSLKKLPSGFTIIEIMIMLAIASLILLVVFEAITHLQHSRRDSERKSYARGVLAALLDFQTNNYGLSTNCNGSSTAAECAAAPVKANRFITSYMPEGTDPSTGNSYRSDTTQDIVTPYCHGVATPSQSTVYCWYDQPANFVKHTVEPDTGQIYIIPGHLCGSNSDTTPYGDRNITDTPNAQAGGTPYGSVVVIIIGTESGDFYCVNS